MAEHLFLVGMMGAGKSTVGRLVADALGWEFVDTDAEVERAMGETVGEVFSRRGEAAFRAEERRAVAAAGQRIGPVVVSVGGGAVLDEANRRVMGAGSAVVWLRARAETLVRRVGTGAGRPLVAGAGQEAPASIIGRLESERRAGYEQIATAIVDVDDLSPAAAAEAVLSSGGATR